MAGADSHDVFGWGVNLAGSINVTDSDTMQLWGVFGQGVGGIGNDTSFENSGDAFRLQVGLLYAPFD